MEFLATNNIKLKGYIREWIFLRLKTNLSFSFVQCMLLLQLKEGGLESFKLQRENGSTRQ